jgi:hypothetical protein
MLAATVDTAIARTTVEGTVMRTTKIMPDMDTHTTMGMGMHTVKTSTGKAWTTQSG